MKASGEQTLFRGRCVRVGAFRRFPWDPPFRDTGPIGGYLLVFPRTPVVITHAGAAPVLADASRVMLYNQGQEYTRRSVGGRGDECDTFAFDPALVVDAVRERDARVEDRRDRPFTTTHAPVDPATYLLQRRVFEHVARAEKVDAAFVEEAALHLLARAVAATSPPRSRDARASTRRAHAELAEACRHVLARHLDEPMSLDRLARTVDASPFHVARVFRRETGVTLHAHRRDLRLAASLEQVLACDDLARVAVDLGFATHSHFTSEFRRVFGVTPSAFRGGAAPKRARS